MTSTVLYFSPTLEQESIVEQTSIKSVVGIVSKEASIKMQVCPNWPSLIESLQTTNGDILVVFRQDFLQKKHMMLDEVLSMLSSLTKFVSNKHVDIAVVVSGKCDANVIAKMKRNNVLGVIPGMRFFDKKYSIEAYQALTNRQSHWPAIVLSSLTKETKKSVGLTDRQYEVFLLIAKRGLTNKQVAQRLNLAESTVKNHVTDILKRFGLKTRTQLALANETDIIKYKSTG
jgi:DNA-binding NarL/FixJ family response regulator